MRILLTFLFLIGVTTHAATMIEPVEDNDTNYFIRVKINQSFSNIYHTAQTAEYLSNNIVILSNSVIYNSSNITRITNAIKFNNSGVYKTLVIDDIPTSSNGLPQGALWVDTNALANIIKWVP